jgi:hypothetical protein
MLAKETKMIKDYLKEIGFGNVRVLKGKDTQADMLNNKIQFSTQWYNSKNKELVDCDKILQKYYRIKLKHDIKISMATYSIFHELGHLISMKDFEGKNFNRVYGQYVVGVNKINKNSSQKNVMYKYRKLQLERLADKYAYAIYLLNENSAIQFDKKMLKQFSC